MSDSFASPFLPALASPTSSARMHMNASVPVTREQRTICGMHVSSLSQSKVRSPSTALMPAGTAKTPSVLTMIPAAALQLQSRLWRECQLAQHPR